ncbi:ornithine cyclodeaminase family protein [Haloarculaceae archaeon H-GB2-1]|nr:ornithine cyclodeaminase family protein [Haloarculaceae archaeon H-GB1-1]MEA5408049.1 ornithine cyclodeaminase family protein [Haloarculaceae archaeon H-GB2-1]
MSSSEEATPTGTRVITAAGVREHVDIESVVDAIEDAFAAYQRGESNMPPKTYVDLPGVDGDFRAMPAQVGDDAGVKWVNVHPDNPGRFGLPTVMGLVVYSDPESGYPLAVIDGTELTRFRTGAAAGVATQYLAPDDADSLGILGAGEQAHTQLAAIASVVDLEEVVVSDLDEDAVERFIDRESDRDVDIVGGSPKDVAGCDVISTTTPASEPIIKAEWVDEGTHINAMGADAEGKQELDHALLDESVVIDDWEQCSHSGEINVAVSEGSFTEDDVTATLGDVVTGETDVDQSGITVFDSTGLAIQDIVTARQVFDAAVEADAGQVIDIVQG